MSIKASSFSCGLPLSDLLVLLIACTPILGKMSEEIPKQGWGGVVVNEGKDFHLEVQKIDVPECSQCRKIPKM